MDRRAALAALGAAALAPSAIAQGRMRRVGYLSGGSDGEQLWPGLAKRGHVRGRTLTLDVRKVGSTYEGVEAAARELVRARPDALIAWGSGRVSALSRETRTIPIVAGSVGDPVRTGLAKSLGRPGTNVTGLTWGVVESFGFHIGLLRGVVPGLRRLVAVTSVPGLTDEVAPALIGAGREAGVEVEYATTTDDAVESAFADLRDPTVEAAYVFPMRPDTTALERVVAATQRRRIATCTPVADYARQGLLLAHEMQFSDEFDRVAHILDAILRGANPAEIPFERPDRTRLVVNRGTARKLGIALPPDLLIRADEVVG